MLALVLLAVGAFAWRGGYAPRFMATSVDDKPANASRLSIVVLPFENLSGDKEQDYFADGITDDLTTDLSHLFDFVIARGTAFTYKGKPVDAKQIGRELGVRYVLEGSVRRLEDKVMLNAQLISTETGAHVWADRFDGERSRLGQLQMEFVARLANSLGVELVKAEALRAARERPNNPDAVDLEMRGWAAYQSWGLASVKEALGYFERALNSIPATRGRRSVWRKRLSTDLCGWEAVMRPSISRAQSRWSPAPYPPSRTTPRRIIQKRTSLLRRSSSMINLLKSTRRSKTIKTSLRHMQLVEICSLGPGARRNPSRRTKLRSG